MRKKSVLFSLKAGLTGLVEKVKKIGDEGEKKAVTEQIDLKAAYVEQLMRESEKAAIIELEQKQHYEDMIELSHLKRMT